MRVIKCISCGEPTAEGVPVCPACMKAGSAPEAEVEAAKELCDLAAILQIADGGEKSIAAGIDAILRRADRLEITRG